MARRASVEPTKTSLAKWPWRVNLPGSITSSGKRERHFFRTKQEASTFSQAQKIRLQNHGTSSSSLTPGQMEDAARALEKLSGTGLTLNEAVAECLRLRGERSKSVTFKKLFESFVETKSDRSAAYLRGLKYTLPRFAGIHERLVSEIRPEDIEGEMEGMTATVRNAFMRNLRAVFNYGIKRGWLAENPIEKLDFESVRLAEVVTLTPKQAEALMQAAANCNELLPYHALALFAGIRPMELERLQWGQVDLVEGHVEILPAVSKTGRRRIIPIEKNLASWLAHFIAQGGEAKGNVTPAKNLRKRLREIRAEAGLEEWTQDVMRHSYASMWLAQNEDINRLTLALGHESPTMLWKHYHRVAKRADAAKFWNILPTRTDKKVIPMTSAA